MVSKRNGPGPAQGPEAQVPEIHGPGDHEPRTRRKISHTLRPRSILSILPILSIPPTSYGFVVRCQNRPDRPPPHPSAARRLGGESHHITYLAASPKKLTDLRLTGSLGL